MPLICNMWPRCRHVQWHDANGTTVEPTIEMLPTVQVAVYPWRCQVCEALGHPYYVPRGSHLLMAEIAAEEVLRAAKPGDSVEEVYRKADFAAFYQAPIDDYHEGPLGGWGPGAGWDPEIPEYDISSTASSHARNDDLLADILSNESIMLPVDDIFQTAGFNTSSRHEAIAQSPEAQPVPGAASSDSCVADRPQSSGGDSGYHTGDTQTTPDYAINANARPDPVMPIFTSFSTRATTPSSSSPAAASTLGAAASSHAPVATSTSVDPTATTIGLTLIINGSTYPRIESGKERWYTQRPGRSNSYSRYSDLVKFDTSKGVRPAPKASKAQLEAARLNRTFG